MSLTQKPTPSTVRSSNVSRPYTTEMKNVNQKVKTIKPNQPNKKQPVLVLR